KTSLLYLAAVPAASCMEVSPNPGAGWHALSKAKGVVRRDHSPRPSYRQGVPPRETVPPKTLTQASAEKSAPSYSESATQCTPSPCHTRGRCRARPTRRSVLGV